MRGLQLIPADINFQFLSRKKIFFAFSALMVVASIGLRSEEHTSELQSHSFISYAVFCLKKKKNNKIEKNKLKKKKTSTLR